MSTSSSASPSLHTPIPVSALKLVHNVKEIVKNHSDDEIYVALKESSMDPDEAVHKLMHQGVFFLLSFSSFLLSSRSFSRSEMMQNAVLEKKCPLIYGFVPPAPLSFVLRMLHSIRKCLLFRALYYLIFFSQAYSYSA